MGGAAIPGLLVPAALALATFGLSAAGVQFLGTDPAALSSAESSEPMEMPAIPPAAGPVLMSEEALRRPVFHRDRAPIDDPGAAPAAAAADQTESGPASGPPAFELRGVVIMDGIARAGLLPPGTSELTWVTKGQDINGWTVEAVTDSAVRLRSGDETAVISIIRDAQ